MTLWQSAAKRLQQLSFDHLRYIERGIYNFYSIVGISHDNPMGLKYGYKIMVVVLAPNAFVAFSRSISIHLKRKP